MGKETAISWTDSTFNPWWGCKRVSPECAHCYADTWAKRTGHKVWDNDTFRFFGDAHWRAPIRLNAEAEAAGKPRFMFCASMADVFQDDHQLDEHRERLWQVIDDTPWLVWLLLTKRPENIGRLAPWAEAPPNVWLGTSIGNARHTFRVAQLIKTPAIAHFLSCEPLLGSLYRTGGKRRPLELDDIEWVIVGGESGARHRPMNLDHAREIRDACAAADVAFWFKQIGGRFPDSGGHLLDGVEHYNRPTPVSPLAPTLF